MDFTSFLIAELGRIRKTYKALDWSDINVVTDNLVFMHQMMVASENILRLGIDRLVNGKGYDAELREYFQRHLLEEKSHAEWLADDLVTAGVDVAKIPLRVEAVAAAGSQYYLGFHAHPSALLGYMAYLECFPISELEVRRLEMMHGTELLRTLRYHAVHDLEHRKDLSKIIDETPSMHKELIFNNAVQTALYLGGAVEKFGVR